MNYNTPCYTSLLYVIGWNRSRDTIVSLLSGRLSVHSAHFWQFSLKIWHRTIKNDRVLLAPMSDRFPRKFDVQTSYKPSNFILGLTFVVSIKFSWATYHTIKPSTEELHCLNTTCSCNTPCYTLLLHILASCPCYTSHTCPWYTCCGSILSLVQFLFSFVLHSLSHITTHKNKGKQILNQG